MGKPKGYKPVIRRNGKGGQEYIQNTIRFPPNIYERLRFEAEKSGRSLHAEILLRVANSLDMEFEIEAPLQGGSLLQQIADDLRAMRQFAELGRAAQA